MTSSIEFPMRREGMSLVLASPTFADEFTALKEGVDLMVARPRRARSPQQHSWVWAVLSAICKAGAWDGDPESLLRYIKMRINFGDWYPMSNGQAVFVPGSISFASCEQTAFSDFVRQMEACLAEHLHVDVGTVFRDADQTTGWKHDLELTAEHVETKAVEPPPKQLTAPVSTPPLSRPESLEDRLMAIAVALDATNLIAVNKKWATLKARAEIKALWKEAGPAVETILKAAQEHAKGDINRRRFNEAVERAVDSVAQRWRAA